LPQLSFEKKRFSSARTSPTTSSILSRIDSLYSVFPRCRAFSLNTTTKLLTKFCHCAKEGLEIFFGTVLGLDDGILGMIMVIRTFGDYTRFPP